MTLSYVITFPRRRSVAAPRVGKDGLKLILKFSRALTGPPFFYLFLIAYFNIELSKI